MPPHFSTVDNWSQTTRSTLESFTSQCTATHPFSAQYWPFSLNQNRVIESIIFGVNAFSQSCIFSTDIENAKIATGKILRLLKGYNSVVEQPDYQLNKCRGEIRFQNVCFTYPSRGSSLILDRISFCIQPGQKVALVGASGCGKSTIIQLLERFYEPQRGNIVWIFY